MPPSTAKIPKQSRSRARVDAILRATTDLLCQDGVAKLTTNHIAGKAGIPVASLYRYFSNKEAILAVIYERYLEQERAMFAANTAGPDLTPIWLSSQEQPGQDASRLLGRELRRAKELYPELSELHARHLAIASEASIPLFQQAGTPFDEDQIRQLIQYMDDLIASFLEAVTRPGADSALLTKLHETAMLGVLQYFVPQFEITGRPTNFPAKQ